ncbi:alpha/beta fold hydrolase [Paludibaculum fermentans]|uniref:alpha/beta fold hydrolase n=1 Tax=Paludibaculum fermentans TaxID=1473598 RepID=UPI003EBDD341
MSFRSALLLLTVGGLTGSALSGQAALKPGRKYTTVERLAPERLAAVHAARSQFAAARKPGPPVGVYQDFPAVLHVHAEDAPHTLGKRAEVLAAAKQTGIRVVMLSDHNGPKPDTWHGLRDGVLFLAGAENGGKHELVYPSPAPGVRFHSHPEGQLDASPDGWDGMEIYNRHADAEDDTDFLAYLKSALAVPAKVQELSALFRQYPDEAFASGCDYWPEIFARWDRISATRPFTGIAANDAHQNQVFAGGKLVLDPYPVAFRNTVAHILARELSEPAVIDSLRAGRAYVSHDWLCDPDGFSFVAANNLGVFEMGDTVPLASTTRLVARSPIPAKWKFFQDGKVVSEQQGAQVSFTVPGRGSYRAEAWLEVDGEQRPWIYTNAIRADTPDSSKIGLPGMTLDAGITVEKDIQYTAAAPEDAAKLQLDIYKKSDLPAGAPVLFFVHGGAWKSGDRKQYPFFGNLFAKAGYVVVVPSYRLSPRYKHPTHIEDIAAAFAWTVRNVAAHGGDPSKILAAGHSAGGHLVALLATNPKYLAAHNLDAKSIRGVLALSGVYDVTGLEGSASSNAFVGDAELLKGASPIKQIQSGLPPFLVTYCQWDYGTLPQQAIEFHNALKSAGLRSQLVYIPGESHITEMTNITKSTDALAQTMKEFMGGLQ